MNIVNDSSGVGSSRNNEGANLLELIGIKTQYQFREFLVATLLYLLKELTKISYEDTAYWEKTIKRLVKK